MSILAGHLLVVDWDYFFPNPLESGCKPRPGEDPILYDWGHSESMFMIDDIWGTRIEGFERNGLTVPDVDQRWRKFADRFSIDDDAVIKFAESNTFAGSRGYVGDDFESVWLFDAHHDLYQHTSVDDFLKKNTSPEGTQISCEDWMFWHKSCGSDLVWRFPDWHEIWKEVHEDDDLDIAREVNLDWKVDDWQPVDVEFTDVFICRSGAWVPPWCDDEFNEFIHSFGRDTEQVGPNMSMERTAWQTTRIPHLG